MSSLCGWAFSAAGARVAASATAITIRSLERSRRRMPEASKHPARASIAASLPRELASAPRCGIFRPNVSPGLRPLDNQLKEWGDDEIRDEEAFRDRAGPRGRRRPRGMRSDEPADDVP